MASYLVTGGAGFIGSHLSEELVRRGHRVRVVDSLITGNRRNLDHVPGVELIEGDLAGSIDAEKAMAAGLPAVQINTGGECHLDAVMLADALPALPLKELDLVMVENVGNLVCPANFQIGTHLNVLIASIPEGDDKPYKYPGMYRGMQVLIINKIDLLPYVPFNMDYFKKGVEVLNPGVEVFAVSCKTGENMDAWVDWLIRKVKPGS